MDFHALVLALLNYILFKYLRVQVVTWLQPWASIDG